MGLLEAWALTPEPATFAPNSKWSNKDMDVVPEHLRTWTTWDFIAYWLSDCANAATWSAAGSMLAVGLSWRQVLSAIAGGYFIIGVVITLNGTIGARSDSLCSLWFGSSHIGLLCRLHTTFPVINRSSFGFYFSYFCVVSRAILATFW